MALSIALSMWMWHGGTTSRLKDVGSIEIRNELEISNFAPPKAPATEAKSNPESPLPNRGALPALSPSLGREENTAFKPDIVPDVEKILPPTAKERLHPDEDAIRRFVEAFLEGENGHDPTANVEKYADTVEYFRDGVVNPIFIKADKLKYLDKWASHQEELTGAIEFEESGDGYFTVRYPTHFRVEDASKHWIEGDSSNSLYLLRKDGAFLITRQDVQIKNRQKGIRIGPSATPVRPNNSIETKSLQPEDLKYRGQPFTKPGKWGTVSGRNDFIIRGGRFSLMRSVRFVPTSLGLRQGKIRYPYSYTTEWTGTVVGSGSQPETLTLLPTRVSLSAKSPSRYPASEIDIPSGHALKRYSWTVRNDGNKLVELNSGDVWTMAQ